MPAPADALKTIAAASPRVELAERAEGPPDADPLRDAAAAAPKEEVDDESLKEGDQREGRPREDLREEESLAVEGEES